MRVDVAAELDGLAALHARTEALTALPARNLAAVAAAVSHWSAAAHVEHALRTDVAVFGRIDAALAGGPVPTTDAGPTAVGAAVLAAGAIRRGVAEAPAAFRPSPDCGPDALRALAESHASALARLTASADAVAGLTVRIPHPYLGGLTPAEWTRFCRIHLAHHLAIARDVLAAVPPAG